VTRSFAMLEHMAIRYQETCEGVGAEDLVGFFTHWHQPRTPTEHLALLQGSTHVVLAIDERSGHVVGFVTALSDGIQAAFIPLLEVLPEYQGRGVGGELMRRVLGRLTDLPAVDLTCRPEMQTFYARFGMRPSVGAVLRRH
jgi:ribosomal protein S18 acetylase RimI-like enzyme